eukprot:Tbor_TRINITY_DN5483_c0_g1::TRINITY_DN5483_c0_g1_i1::g.24500::m.24500
MSNPQSDYDSEDEWAKPVKALPDPPSHKPTDININTLDSDERDLACGIVIIHFTLPDGSRITDYRCVMGQTIGYMKQGLEDCTLGRYRYNNIILLLDGVVLIDPLSLNDIPGFEQGKEHEVVVKLVGEK